MTRDTNAGEINCTTVHLADGRVRQIPNGMVMAVVRDGHGMGVSTEDLKPGDLVNVPLDAELSLKTMYVAMQRRAMIELVPIVRVEFAE